MGHPLILQFYLPLILSFPVHLHNQFILGILFNASANVPGPSSPKSGASALRSKREGRGTIVSLTGEILSDSSDAEDDMDGGDSGMQLLQPPRKRLRALAAGLSKRDRVRVKSIAKAATSSRNLAGSGSASLGWAGAGADMLEKKRKEEEKRRMFEEKRRVKEVYSDIGARDWREEMAQGARRIADVQSRLSLCECLASCFRVIMAIPYDGRPTDELFFNHCDHTATQQAVARGQAMPLCVESKELPNCDALQDVMTVQAVDVGLPAGVQPQAAALLLAALQVCQAVASLLPDKGPSSQAAPFDCMLCSAISKMSRQASSKRFGQTGRLAFARLGRGAPPRSGQCHRRPPKRFKSFLWQAMVRLRLISRL